MNMINYYLLKGQSEFLHVKQKQLPCLSSLYVCILAQSWSSDTAQQVTCMSGDTCLKLHSFQMSVACFLLCWRFCFLFPPNSLSSLSFSLPFFLDTSVSDMSVSSGQASSHLFGVTTYIHERLHASVLQVSRLCTAKPTAWKRGCGEVKLPPNSPLSKRERCNACTF